MRSIIHVVAYQVYSLAFLSHIFVFSPLTSCSPQLYLCYHTPRTTHNRGFKRVAGQKVPNNTIAYYNKCFIRGKAKLLKNMNGGKTKFVCAREKRMRSQLKRERDREQAVLIAAQQQANYAEQLGLGSLGLNNNAQAGLLRLGGLDHTGLNSLLASRPTAFQQQLQLQQSDGMRVADHVFAAEQALAMQQQREALQLRLLRQGGGGAMQGFSSLRDPRDVASTAASNQWLARNVHTLNQSSQLTASSLAGLRLSQLQQQNLQQQQQQQRSSGDAPLPTYSGVDMTAEQLLLNRQMAAMAAANNSNNIQASMAQRMMAQRMGTAGFANMHTEAAAAKMVQQRMNEEQIMKMAAAAANSPSQKPMEGGQRVDPQLLQLIWMQEQQRKKDMAQNRDAR